MAKVKRTFAIAVAALLAVSALAACAGDGGTSPESGTASSESTETAAPESEAAEGTSATDSGEVFTLDIPSHKPEKLNENQEIRKLIEEKLNIKINVVQYLEKEALNLKLASGDVPEFFWGITMADYHKYADQGLLAELPVETIKASAPGLADWAERSAGGDQVWSYYDHDGKNFAIPELWTLATDGKVVGYREAILQQCGFDAASATLEELESFLAAAEETLGIAALTSESSVTGLSFVYGAYGTYLTYYEKDSSVVYGPLEEEAKQAVSLMRDWYAAGYIDPEFVINKFDNTKEKWGNDQAAVMEFYWWDFLPKEAFFDGRLYEVNAGKDNQTNLTALPPTGPNGDLGITQGNPVVSGGAVFGKQMESQPEKLAKYLEFFNCSTDREMMDLASYGIEGETYNYNNETGVEWLAPFDTEEKRDEFGINLYSYPGCFNDYDLQAKYMTQPSYLQLRQDAQKNGVGSYSVFEPFYRPVYNEKSEVLDKIYKNAHIDFITGARPLEEWDDFVAEWRQSGGDAVLAETQEILDNMK